LNKLYAPVPVIKRPIDCELQHPWEFDLLIYNILPSIIHHMDLKTQIHTTDKSRKSEFIRRIVYEWKRVFPKYYYLISHHGIKNFCNSFILKKTPKVR